MAGAYEIVSNYFRVVIIEKNNEEQGNSTPKVNKVEYSTVLSLTISNRKQTMCVCTSNISPYGLSPFNHKALVSANTFKFGNLIFFSCLSQRSGMNTIRSRGYNFFSCPAEIILTF